LVFSNEEGMVSDVAYLPGLGSSDHVCIRFNLNCYSKHINNTTTKLNLHKADYVKMRELLSAVDWQEAIDPLQITDAWNLFSSTLDNAIETCIPKYRPSTRKNTYMTREALYIFKMLKTSCGVNIVKLAIQLSFPLLPIQGTPSVHLQDSFVEILKYL